LFLLAAPSFNKRGRLQAVPVYASSDKCSKILEAHIKKHQFRPEAQLRVLHKAQGLCGYLEDALLLFSSNKLKPPPSRIYGVATFHDSFTTTPQGEHTCVACMGTACYVKCPDKINGASQDRAKIRAGEKTADSKASLLAG
jgi:bidirectional [NiFe] hydrogenase diaphorase subunit